MSILYRDRNISKIFAISKIFVGDEDCIPREIQQIYSGKQGIPKLVWQNAEVEDGQIFEITESGIWTVPAGVKHIDAFIVGGGAGGNGCYWPQNQGDHVLYCGAGGSGGKTKTIANVTVKSGQTYAVIIGTGGTGGTGGASYSIPDSVFGENGGSTLFGGVEAEGGKNAKTIGAKSFDAIWKTGVGGSGGGCGSYQSSSYSSLIENGGNGGSNGENGYEKTNTIINKTGGQGISTKSFSEQNGTLYGAGGGGGQTQNGTKTAGKGGAGGGGNGGGAGNNGFENATGAVRNTGSGGGGGGYNSGKIGNGGNGASGVVLLRCHLK